VRRDFEKQSGEAMTPEAYVFSQVSFHNSATEMGVVFEVRDTSMFSYTNFGYIFANMYSGKEGNLASVVEFLEGSLYDVPIEDSSIPLLTK
jgi:hypothetical protein